MRIDGELLLRLTGAVRRRRSEGDLTRHENARQGHTGYRQTNYVDPAPTYTGYADSGYAATPGYGETTGYGETAGYGETTPGGVAGTGAGAPLPPPPYGTTPPPGSVVPPTTPAGWDDPNRTTGGV